MKTVIYRGESIECFQNQDFEDPKFIKIVDEARELWNSIVEDWIAEKGDKGAIVMGNGITVSYLPPRKRKPREKIIIEAPGYASDPTDATWKEIASFLADQGIQASYKYGRID